MVSESEEVHMIDRIIDEAWNQGNLQVVDEFLTDEYVLDDPHLGREIRGAAGLKRVIGTFREAFPDLEMIIDHRVSSQHDIVDGYMVRGTHEGELMGIEPTGNEVEVRGLVIHRFRDHELVEDYCTTDFLGMLKQLGVVDAELMG